MYVSINFTAVAAKEMLADINVQRCMLGKRKRVVNEINSYICSSRSVQESLNFVRGYVCRNNNDLKVNGLSSIDLYTNRGLYRGSIKVDSCKLVY